MEAGGEFIGKRGVDSPVLSHPRQSGKFQGSDPDRIMGPAPGGCARMPLVKVGVIPDGEELRRKSFRKAGPDTIRPVCQFLRH